MRDWHTAVCGICSCSVVANRLSWAAWETGIQLCVASVPVQLWLTNCHGLCVASVAVQLWQTGMSWAAWETGIQLCDICSCSFVANRLSWAVCGICSCSVMAKRMSWAVWETGIQLCVASVAVQLWLRDCHGLQERHPWHVQHSCSNRTQITLWFIRDEKTFQLHYRTVNQSHSQQMCKCLAIADIALCLHAVQQCGCKIVLSERK